MIAVVVITVVVITVAFLDTVFAHEFSEEKQNSILRNYYIMVKYV